MNAPGTFGSLAFSFVPGYFAALPHLRDAPPAQKMLHWLRGNFRGLLVSDLLLLMRV
jgi:hypothetical protein